MSHIATYQATLKAVSQDLLKKALEIVAKKFRGQVSDSIDSVDEGKNVREWLGRKIFAAIRTKELPQGVGIIFNGKNEMEFVYDKLYVAERTTNFVRNETFWRLAHESEEAFKAITKEIEFTYKTLAIASALKKLNYTVEAQTAKDGAITLQAEKETA